MSFNAQYLRALDTAISGTPVYEPSRAGEVINLGQAFFEINSNDPRIPFLKGRGFNCSFAMVEAAWILLGSRELQPLLREIPSYGKYSDDGSTLNGAYGYRLRHYFGKDQLDIAVQELKQDPNSRRVVLSLYGSQDLGIGSKDIPCNTSIFLKIRDRKLDLTVINRSNDLFLGLPYNVFTFGILQLYLARQLQISVGTQRHFTDSLHLYREHIPRSEEIVQNNTLDEVERESAQFDWEYAKSVVDSAESLLDGAMEKVTSNHLRHFLLWCHHKERDNAKQDDQSEFEHFFSFLRSRVGRRRLNI
ncbi:thymidylate synthase [Herbaspirillum sp. C7C2]|nr:thymidylate synthase [Herbaspirillum sp. C7C2]